MGVIFALQGKTEQIWLILWKRSFIATSYLETDTDSLVADNAAVDSWLVKLAYFVKKILLIPFQVSYWKKKYPDKTISPLGPIFFFCLGFQPYHHMKDNI